MIPRGHDLRGVGKSINPFGEFVNVPLDTQFTEIACMDEGAPIRNFEPTVQVVGVGDADEAHEGPNSTLII